MMNRPSEHRVLTRAALSMALCIVSAALAASASAQQTVRGRLEAGDKVLMNGALSDEYAVRVRAGSRLTVTLDDESPLLAAALLSIPPNDDFRSAPEFETDFRGDLTIYTAVMPESETVTLIVASGPATQRGATGTYTLTVDAPGGGLVQSGGSASPRRPEPASPAPRPAGAVPEVITRQLAHFVATAQEAGFRLVSQAPVGGALNNGTYEDVSVTLSARQYFIVGVCDGDCTDMDLRLFSRGETVLAEDVADDDTPMLSFTAATAGEHRLRVMMPACSSEPCAYGISVYAK